MSTSPRLDPLIARQLKRAGVSESGAPPSPEAWEKFLHSVSEHYRHLADDHELLSRSMEISTHEMEEMRSRIESQRDQLSQVVDAIGSALQMFGGLVQRDDEISGVVGLEHAKIRFAQQLQELFGTEAAHDDSSQVSSIRTNLVQLADQLIHLLTQTADKALLQKELEVARVVQKLLVPADGVMQLPTLRIAGHFQPASECGGDWWSVYQEADGRELVIIGDVTGHGISSAIITGAAKASCDLAHHMTEGRVGPGELLKLMNVAIHETAQRQIMMTCAAGSFDPVSRQLQLANAGHPFPLLVRDGGVRSLMAHGQPLGSASGSTYETVAVPFASRDLLVWFTDGVIECENERGEPFGDKRLRLLCQRTAAAGAEVVRDAVVGALQAHRGSRAQVDDITLVVASVS
jgi:serine phosphatase RsbU (regulator of sigma subunit)